MALYQPGLSLSLDEQQGLYFMLFRERTANELSGFFDSAFWSRTVLQACHYEPAIRHAVVALGALYKTLEKSTESPAHTTPANRLHHADSYARHWEVAVKQYGDAIGSIGAASRSSDPTAHRTCLMSNVLLACFDSFVGHHKEAILQIQSGLRLLETMRTERRRAFTPQPDVPVEEELVQMFKRLAIQAKSYDMAFHFPHPYVVQLSNPLQVAGLPDSPVSEAPPSPFSDLSTPSPVPDVFHSLREARMVWDTLCERVFRFRESMFAYAQSGHTGLLPTSLQQYGHSHKRHIQQWSEAFESILASRTAPGVTSQEKAGIAVLKMTQLMGHILFLMTFHHSEMQFDKYTQQFRAVVDLAQEVVADEERRAVMLDGHDGPCAARHIRASFSADLGIVPPLFVVATKCRHPVIRRQAIQLLRSSARREGMWDSELTARIGEWVAIVEEAEDDVAVRPFSMPCAPEPMLSPGSDAAHSWPSTASSTACAASPLRNGSGDVGDAALGPGRNARWDAAARRSSGGSSAGSPRGAAYIVPEERRVMVRAAEFDLRNRFAVVQLGTRGLHLGSVDGRTKITRIEW